MPTSLDALTAQVSDLAAQVSRLKIRASVTPALPAPVAAAASGRTGLTLVDPVELDSGTSTQDWSTADISPFVPGSATAALLLLYDKSNANLDRFTFRAVNGRNEADGFSWNPSGGTSTITVQAVAPVLEQRFDYKVLKSSANDWSITLIGYYG